MQFLVSVFAQYDQADFWCLIFAEMLLEHEILIVDVPIDQRMWQFPFK